jgi:hypothetical protein
VTRLEQRLVFESLSDRVSIRSLSELSRVSAYSPNTWRSVMKRGYLTANNDGTFPVHRAREAMSHYQAEIRAKRRTRVVGRPFQRKERAL